MPVCGSSAGLKNRIDKGSSSMHATKALDLADCMHVPFFWSQHYDVQINYVGHATEWDAIEIEGEIARRECLVRYRKSGELRAVASSVIALGDHLPGSLFLRPEKFCRQSGPGTRQSPTGDRAQAARRAANVPCRF